MVVGGLLVIGLVLIGVVLIGVVWVLGVWLITWWYGYVPTRNRPMETKRRIVFSQEHIWSKNHYTGNQLSN